MSPPSQLVAGRYELGEKVRDGLAFRVHRGTDTKTGRPVRVRVLKPQLWTEPEVRVGFRRLASAPPVLAPGIARVLAVSDWDDTLAVVEQSPSGKPLAAWESEGGVVDPARAVGLLSSICEVVEALHSSGSAHGLLSPHEVFLGPGGAPVEVAGVGLAAAFGGRPVPGADENPYLAPEQRRGQGPTPRSDVYALAVMLIEAVTGSVPPARVLDSKSWRRGVPTGLQSVLAAALATDPAARYRDASAFARALHLAMPTDGDVALSDAPETGPPAEAEGAAVAPVGEPGLDGAPAGATTSAPVPFRARALSCLVGILYALIIPLAVGVPLASAYLRWERSAPREVRVPDLAASHTDINLAHQQLEALHLKLRVVDEAYSPEVGDGRIVWQSPAGGRVIKEGRMVDVRVSRGARPVSAPTVINLGQDEAADALKQARLQVGDVVQGYSRAFPKGVVLSQAPHPGEQIVEGGKVNLLVSLGPNAAEDWEGVDAGGAESRPVQVRFSVPKGEGTQRIQLRVVDTKGSRIAYDALHEPGDTVSETVSVVCPGKVETLVNGQLGDSKDITIGG